MNRYIALRETGSDVMLLVDTLRKTVEAMNTPMANDLGRLHRGLDVAVVLPDAVIRETARFHFDDEDELQF